MSRIPWNSRATVRLAVVLLAALVLAGAAATTATAQEVKKEKKLKQAQQAGWLGVQLQELDGPVAKALGLQPGAGALISAVEKDSPAAAAGLEEGDIVLRFDGAEIKDTGDLTNRVRRAAPGDAVPIVIRRGGVERTHKVTLGQRPRESGSRLLLRGGDGEVWRDLIRRDGEGPLARFFEAADGPFLGVQLGSLSEQLGEYFGAEEGRGALVREVTPDSPAAQAGLKAGDVIVALGGKPVDTPADVRRALRKADPGDTMEITLLRERRERKLKATLSEPPDDIDIGGDDVRIMRWHDDLASRLPRDFDLQRHLSPDRREMETLREELRTLREELRDLKDRIRGERR